MENKNWAELKGNALAPYLNTVLLPMASYCDEYYNPPLLHPSLPNYLWLEAGTNFGALNVSDPLIDHFSSTNHLATYLNNAGISWRTYQEDIDGRTVPLVATNFYAPRHNPFVFFDDVTGTNNPQYAYGINHIRPYAELEPDLRSNAVARYNFLKPNLTNDTHDGTVDVGDAWLAREIPKILASPAYTNGGAIFLTWDEGIGSDGPIGMIVLSPFAKGGGYHNGIHYTHSSTLRTIQEIFGLTNLLGDAARAASLLDLFQQVNLIPSRWSASTGFELSVTGLFPGRTYRVESSINHLDWIPIATNAPSSNSITLQHLDSINSPYRFYRAAETPPASYAQ